MDGSNSSAVSPHATAAALEEQLTCEGLEKDSDLEVQHAYISSQLRQREARQATLQQQASSSSSGVSAEAPVAAAARAAAADVDLQQEKDAPRSKSSRDQAQQCRIRRDQVQQYRDRPPVEVSTACCYVSSNSTAASSIILFRAVQLSKYICSLS